MQESHHHHKADSSEQAPDAAGRAETEGTQQPHPAHWPCRWPSAQACFDFLLVLFTLGLVITSYLQWQAVKDTLTETKRLVDAARIQANAAAASVKTAQDANDLARDSVKTSAESAQQTLVANQRAWLGPSHVKLDEAPVVGKQLNFSVVFHNTGKEPARNVASLIESGMIVPEEKVLSYENRVFQDKCLNLQERIDGQVVYPSTGFATAILSSFTEEMISEPVINGKRWLPIRGCFAYRTFDQVRHSSFCYVYKGGITQPNQVDICKDGNYAD